MARARSFGVDPKCAAAQAADRRDANLHKPPARQGRHQGFERLPIGELPGSGEGKHAPIAQFMDEHHLGARGICRIANHHDFLAPGERPELAEHLPEQGIFGRVVKSPLVADQREIDGDG